MKISRRALAGSAAALLILTAAPAVSTLATDDIGSSSSSTSVSSETNQSTSASSAISTSSAQSSSSSEEVFTCSPEFSDLLDLNAEMDMPVASGTSSVSVSDLSATQNSTSSTTSSDTVSAETDPSFSISPTAAPATTADPKQQLKNILNALPNKGIIVPKPGSLPEIDGMTRAQLEQERSTLAKFIAANKNCQQTDEDIANAILGLNDNYSSNPPPPPPPTPYQKLSAAVKRLAYILQRMILNNPPIQN